MLLPLFFVGCSLFGRDELSSLRSTVTDADGTTLPVALADAAPDVPPLRPGELQPLTDAPTTGLGVRGVAPNGPDMDPSQVAVVFDRPMVALDAIDSTSAAVPVRCEPAIEGRARWAGTTTAVIVPTGGRFPPGTEYTCEVPAGSAAADGTTLESTISWSFSTLRPAIERHRPYAGMTDWDPKDPLVLRFNQPVEPAALDGKVRLRSDAGADIPLTFARGNGDRDRPDVVLLHGSLAVDTGYTLTIEPGLRGLGGPLGLAERLEVPFRTYPPARVLVFETDGVPVSTSSPLRLRFSTPVDAAEINPKIHLRPAPPDGFAPAEDFESSSWTWWGRLAPRTEYTLTLDPGARDTHGQLVTGGGTWTFTTGDLPPLLDAPEGFQVYPATNPSEIPVRFRNVSRVDARVETLDPLAFVLSDTASQKWREGTGGVPLELASNGSLNRVQVGTFDLAPFLSAGGHGLLRIRTAAPEVKDWNGDEDTAWALLQVTDLGTTVKLAPDGLTAWITRLSDGNPVPDATVRVVRGGKIVWTGNTDPNGLAVATGDLVPDDWSSWKEPLWVVTSLDDDTALTSHRWDDGLDGWSHGVWSRFDAEQTSLEFASFTDRGVYRPGDTAHVDLSMREASLDGLAVPKRRELVWEFTDPDGRTLAEGTGVADDHGAWAVDLAVPARGPLGDHTLVVRRGADRTSVSVPVKAYRAPAFRVDVKAPPVALAGGTLGVTAEARYLFGAPMKGAAVAWSIGRSPLTLTPPGWEDYSFEAYTDGSEWSERPGYESVSSGRGALDADGRFPIVQALPQDAVARPWTYEIEATVTDTDRQVVSSRTTSDVHVADAYVGVRSAAGLGTVGTPVAIQTVRVTPDGEARPGAAVRLSAVRRTWDVVRERALDGTWRWINTVKDEPVETGTVRTTDSPVSWSFTPKEGGYYVVRAEAEAPGGARTVADTSVYVLGGQVSWARSDTRTLELVTDRRTYAPGDIAKILIKAPKPGMKALVTVEREGVWTRRVITLASTAEAIEVPITQAMMPNAFVTVLAADGAPPADAPDAGKPGVWYGVAPLTVEPEEQRAAVAVTTDREAYQPGEEVRIHLDATLGGKPLADARVTLWAVDYGVLSLTGYQTPDLLGAFYTPRAMGVLTADNRISVYDRAHYLSKGADVGGGGGISSDGDTRRRFETTPLWRPGLRTDKNGALDERFTLPDNLTTFRIMAVVQDARSAFGRAEHEVRVNRPLIARPALPRFFRVGDKAMAGVVVHNNTSTPVEVVVNATVTGASLQGAPRTVKVEPDGAKEVPFALTDFVAPDVSLRFVAEGNGNRDAVELTLPVSSPLPQEVVATSGSTTSTVSETVKSPSGAIRDVGGLTVNVSASALVGVGSAVDYLLDYPHGCLEQVGSRTRIALLARQIGPRAGIETPADRLDAYVRTGLAEMGGFQTPGGGFGYWPGSGPSGPASAYALEILAEADAAGEHVDAATLDRLTTFVHEFLGGRHVPTWWSPEVTQAAQARAALALARAGRGDPAYNSRVWDGHRTLPHYAKAQLLETLARTTGGDARTRALERELEGALKIESTSAALVDRDQDRWSALWYGDDLGTSALVRALMVSAPDHPMLERLAHHLVEARTRGRWANTYTTAEALLALRAYADRHERGAVRADVQLGGRPLLDEDLGSGGQASRFVPMLGLTPGVLAVTAKSGRLYYETRLAYALASMPPRDEGFTLARTYEVLEGTGSGGQVTPGAVVRVTLRVVTPVDRYDVALVDWLPAGLEPIDTTFSTSARADGGIDTGSAWEPHDTGVYEADAPHVWTSSWVFNRRELRDDRVALYADHMPAGIHVQSYLARATTPGDYAHPAATVEQMYAPDVFGRTEAGRFVVGWPVAGR